MAAPSESYGHAWVEFEFLVVLDGYLRLDGHHHIERPEVKEMARLLGRTPASVSMRLENFASVDPRTSSRRRGLDNAGRHCERIWKSWAHRREALSETVDLFRQHQLGIAATGQARLFQPEAVPVPRAFGRYELMDQLGEGGFGVVYSCVDDRGTRRALKIIKTSRESDEESLHRFLREIRALRAVDHPNVIKLHEDNLDTQREFPAYVMDLAEMSLARFLGERNRSGTDRPCLAPDEAVDIIKQVCAGVRALHSHPGGVIHRDINPNNILRLADARWALADFGLAKFVKQAPASTAFVSLTQHKGLGTPFYGAPEQYQNFKLTGAATDIHALGMLAWELFSSAWPPPDRDDLGLPDSIAEVWSIATARRPERRYPSVDAFEQALLDAVARVFLGV
jgi:hypothetical protein